MHIGFIGTAVVTAVLAMTGLAQAQQAAPTHAGNVCLRTTDISSTTVPNDRTILFHMRSGKIWKNELVGSCPGLRFGGFSYVVSPPNQICGDLQSIRVIRTGTVCMLGQFTPYEKAKPAAKATKDAAG